MNKRLKLDLAHIIERGRQAEKSVGLTEFLGTQRAFIGIVKHRYEDFLVNEVDKEGNIIRLIDISQPEEVKLVSGGASDPTIEATTLPISVQEQLAALKLSLENSQEISPVIIKLEESVDTKEIRKKIHQYVKQNFADLESLTQNVEGSTVIKVQPAKPNTNNRGKGRQFCWPSNLGQYVHFNLYKENMETVNILNELAKRLHCSNKSISYAGQKDKRAITVQRLSIWKTCPSKIWLHASRIRTTGGRLRVGDFKFCKEQLRLGDLNGNHFEIVLRNVRLLVADDSAADHLRSEVEASLVSLRNTGFINYFGMQRFGSHAIDSHRMGVHILRHDFKALVQAILSSKSVDARFAGGTRETSLRDALNVWRETGDAGAAYKKLTHKFSLQGSLLRALSRSPKNDFHGALCLGLARNSRTLYLHAYQSYVWNRVVSQRIRKFGLNVIVGDLVHVGKAQGLDDDDGEEEEEGEANPAIKANIPAEEIVIVDEDNRTQFSISDVVLPIPGALSKMPANEMAECITNVLAEDGLTMASFAGLNKQWCVNGSYRKVIAKADNLAWQWIEYVDDKEKLVDSDLDRILKLGQNADHQKARDEEHKAVEQSDARKPELALRVNVTLPTSCYATMMLRELTKVSSVSLEDKPWMLVGEEVGEDAMNEANDSCFVQKFSS